MHSMDFRVFFDPSLLYFWYARIGIRSWLRLVNVIQAIASMAAD